MAIKLVIWADEIPLVSVIWYYQLNRLNVFFMDIGVYLLFSNKKDSSRKLNF